MDAPGTANLAPARKEDDVPSALPARGGDHDSLQSFFPGNPPECLREGLYAFGLQCGPGRGNHAANRCTESRMNVLQCHVENCLQNKFDRDKDEGHGF